MKIIAPKRLMVSVFPTVRNGGIFNASSLDLQFARTKTLDPRITFTRASSGTFVGSDGLIKTATTNLLLRSEEFGNAIWGVSTASIAANAGTAPNGTLTADKLIVNSGSASGYVAQSFSYVSGTVYTFSVYVKADGINELRIVLLATSFGASSTALFNLTNGTVTSTGGAWSSASITSVEGGWYRVVATATATATAGSSTRFQCNTTGDGSIGVLLWGAQLEQSSTAGEYIPTTSTINSAPRFDHNPTTGESLGLLVEEQRTNSIRNNTMVGAVAGTPGTLPTNWPAPVLRGLTQTLAISTDSGVTCLDFQLSGTPTSTGNVNIPLAEPTNAIAALSGQTWTASIYSVLSGGSLANIGTVSLYIQETSSTNTFLASNSTSYVPSLGSLLSTRWTHTRTLSNASTAFVNFGLVIGVTSGQAVDITLRFGLPQLEQGAFATSVIPTSTTAATRSADVASITGSAFSSWYRQDEGTVFASYQFPAGSAVNTNSRQLFDSSDGTTNNRFSVRGIGGASTADQITVRSGASTVAQFSTNGTAPGTAPRAIAAVYRLDDYAAVATGSTSAVTDTSGALPVGLNQANIGGAVNGTEYLSGTIKRFTYWPQRLPNSTLQQITQ
jgi:hypothetical protein